MSAVVHSEELKVNSMDPYVMVETVANNTFDRFHHDIAIIEANPDHLKVIISDELMPYIDVKYASYKVMGSYLRQTSKEQRERFVGAFKGYLISTYAQAFTEYTDQEVKFAQSADFSKEKIVDVGVQIVDGSRPPIKLQFRVRRLKDDSWKAFDLVAEGVSLLASKSSEISNLIRQKGIETVITELEDRTKTSIKRASTDKKA
ncbi:phospholipid-binding protein MlaC [Shewanella sp. VB17]|uniref:MlaC/ttg2D family ABC transporter substrate-binding protein n=1 Tax=Shewanella sp. VB17 TaxID=2739432 RepID=UPI0035C88B60